MNAHDLHAIEVHVMNLRRKLGGTARRCRWIETVRGIGYRFAPAKL
ncbi:winged helix-turn-helix domain-containing protein [Microbacterium oleivorans]|nr:helix-turn-helix domain-containing protein [Microbacterium oleivorans]